jgi:hypothetical protein
VERIGDSDMTTVEPTRETRYITKPVRSRRFIAPGAH